MLEACARYLLQATYLRVPHTARKRVAEEGLPFRDGIHGAGHALVNVLPLFLMCAASDMATECDNPYDTRYRPERLLLYDTHPGGIGLAWQARPSAALQIDLIPRSAPELTGLTLLVQSTIGIGDVHCRAIRELSIMMGCTRQRVAAASS